MAKEIKAKPGCEQITTRRLYLRAFKPTDIDQIVPLADNINVAGRLSSMPFPYQRSDAEDWVGRHAESLTRTNYAICLQKNPDKYMGSIGYGAAAYDEDNFEFGYWLGEPFWGNGYISEALEALIVEIFSKREVERVWANSLVDNKGSMRVMEKCGMTFHSTNEISSKALNQKLPVHRYCLSYTTWLERQGTKNQ